MTMSGEGAKPKGPDTASRDFIRQKIADDLASRKYEGCVVTRFPPEPNGYLHIGHAKSICLNFSIANEHATGRCHLRFDDTNPAKEDVEYVESIQRDIRWLGFDWGEHLHFASDYFEQLYGHAVSLIERGLAYVCSLNEKEIRDYRGSISEAGRPSPYRERSIEENLDLFRRMRQGEFADGAHVVRAKMDMAAPNLKLRDPLLYRIRKITHHRTGDAWCIYPMYDFAHPLSDAIESVTHSLCSLEFENNRPLYDWVVGNTGWEHPPEQTEFARLSLNYTVMSKRKLLRLVETGVVSGWNDPRLPTLAGLRRAGYPPESIRTFCDRVGLAKANSTVDVKLLEHTVRDELNHRAPRVMAVLRPLRVVITNYSQDQSEDLDASYWPHDVPKTGSRPIPFSRVLYIERDDFQENPSKKFFRLAPGREVRLRYAYLITCDEVVKDPESGEITELRCTYDPATRGGEAPDGRKVKATIHWVSEPHAITAEVRLYDRLFAEEFPERDGADFMDCLNPKSLEIVSDARLEPSLAGAAPGSHHQFERQGYFFCDPVDSTPDRLVFNRTVSLKDTWAKVSARGQKSSRPTTAKSPKTPAQVARPTPPSAQEAQPLSADARRLVDSLGLPTSDAQVLASAPDLLAFFEAALAQHNRPKPVANWIVNELLRELKDRPLSDLPFGGGELGALVGLIDSKTISGAAAKQVFEQMLESGSAPGEIVERMGLQQIDDRGQLDSAVQQAIAKNPAQVEKYRGGNQRVVGFFVGQVMKQTKGKADPKLVDQLVRAALEGPTGDDAP